MRNVLKWILAAAAAAVIGLAAGGVTAKAAPVQMADGTTFDATFYAAANPDVVAVFGTDAAALYQHYVMFGRAEGRLAVMPAVPQAQQTQQAAQTPAYRTDVPFPFFIRVNRAANTVTVYGMDMAGQYTVPVKAFVCSVGAPETPTPVGVFQLSDKYRWAYLQGNVWGQYATRIYRGILFHSVPYFTHDPANLEYEEYNKLGSPASLGCVRMSVTDVKWIFDYCPAGTIVQIYDDAANPGPLGKPVPAVIDVNSPLRGIDPTDPLFAGLWQ